MYLVSSQKITYIDELALDRLRSLNRSDDTDFAIQMLEMFLGKTEEHRKWMAEVTSKKNFSDLKNQVHAFKSVSATLGLNELSNSAALLENYILENNQEGCRLEIEKLKQIYSDTCAAVVKYIAEFEI